MSSRSYSARVEHVQHQPACGGCRVDAIGDGPDMDAAVASRATVFSTSISDRPGRSTRHTTTVSPSSAYSRSPFHSWPLDRRLASGCHVGKDVAFLHARGDQCIQLQLGVLAGSTHARITQLPHKAILTRKAPRCTHGETIYGETPLPDAGYPAFPPARAAAAGPPETRGQCLEKLSFIETP